jgi:hypothetical protein
MLSSVRALDDDKASAAKKRKRKSTLDWKLCKSFAYVASSISALPIMLPGSSVPITPQTLLTCASPPSNLPPRKLCGVCGYIAPYTDARTFPLANIRVLGVDLMVIAGTKAHFCSIKCKSVQDETRFGGR